MDPLFVHYRIVRHHPSIASHQAAVFNGARKVLPYNREPRTQDKRRVIPDCLPRSSADWVVPNNKLSKFNGYRFAGASWSGSELSYTSGGSGMAVGAEVFGWAR